MVLEVDLLSFPQILASTAVFISSWFAIDRYVARNGPIPHARTLCGVNSGLYSSGSLILLLLILTPPWEEQARFLYHISKFYEYFDVLLVRASGGIIDLHFGLHHLTTPYLTYFRVIQDSQGWRWVAALNAFHHTILYAFFAGWSAARPVLPVTGVFQLVVGISGEAWILMAKRGEGKANGANVFTLGMLCIYFVLFTRDLIFKRPEAAGEREKKEI
jgi:hypothetical protein